VRLEDDWVPMDQLIDPEELDITLRRKEAQSRAVVLEMIGDIPDAELKPPENVLFVCKLNPVTEVNSYTAFKLFLECCTLKVRVQEGSVDFGTRCDWVVSSFCYSH
jgi:hypothetical protein